MGSPLILRPSCVEISLNATTPTDAIKELVGLLVAAKLVSNGDLLAKHILDREAIRHTGLVKNFALPRGAAHEVVDHCLAIGKFKSSVKWTAHDQLQVEMVILYASPLPKSLDFLANLVALAKVCNKMHNREILMKSGNSADLFDIASTLFATQG